MVGLLVGGRPWQLLRNDAAERQEYLTAIGLGEGLPEVCQGETPRRSRWARGGTGRASWSRFSILPVVSAPGERGSNPPTSRAPVPRLWEAALGTNRAGFRVQSVCIFVIQHARSQYACRSCQEHVAIADKPPQPIDKGLPGPGLMAQTITSKYSDHLPRYRQEDIFARHGVELSRATLSGWMAQAADLLGPLYDLMVKRVLLSKIVHTDDTRVPVWDPTLPHTRTGRFWVYIGDVRNPYVVYDYTPRRTRDGPEQFLKEFCGYLQADAFSGYDRLCAGPDVIEVACWAHVRRKFFEARTSAPVLAHAALARIRQLYAVEHAAEELSAEGCCALRQREAVPLLVAFGEWLTEQGRHVLPKSPIGQAIAYAQSNWAALGRYPEHGELSIDNNLAERMLRAQAIGRKNWTFLGSDRGGHTAAVLYSLTGTCKHHDIDPFAYLQDIRGRFPAQPGDRLGELLPDVWFEARPQARRKKVA